MKRMLIGVAVAALLAAALPAVALACPKLVIVKKTFVNGKAVPAPRGAFTFRVTATLFTGGTRTFTVKNTGRITRLHPKLKDGTFARVCEVRAPKNWKRVGPRCKFIFTGHKRRAVSVTFANRLVEKVPIFIKKHAFVVESGTSRAVMENFRFQLFFNGRKWKKVTIPSTGRLIKVGQVRSGSRVTVQEIGAPSGFTPDKAIQTQVTRRGGNVFLFVNQKVAVPKKIPLEIIKVAEDAGNRQIPVPSNTFIFHVTSDGVTREVRYERTPMSAGECTLGSKVTFTELIPAGWQLVNPTSPTVVLDCIPDQRGVVQAVFKNRQVSVVVQQPAPRQVSVTLCCIKQMRAQGQARICATPSGFVDSVQSLNITFSATRGMIEPHPTSFFQPEGSACVIYTAPSTTGSDTIHVVARDSQGNQAEANRGPFPIE